MKHYTLCRATGTHAWTLVPPIVVLANEDRRVVLHCERCDSWRIDTWSRRHGGLGPRSYQRDPAYQTYLKDHKRDGARLDVLGGGTREVTDAAHHPRLRLLRGGKKGPARVRGRHAHAGKRTTHAG